MNDKKSDDKRFDKSIDRLRRISLDVRQLPDQVGYGDPNISADQLDREIDNLIEIYVTGRGTGQPDKKKD